MLQTTRSFVSSLAVLFLLGALAPAPAHAWPFGNALHLHPLAANGKDMLITFNILNKSDRSQEINVGDHHYTVMPNDSLTIKAPAGTKGFAETESVYHHKGDLLFSVVPDWKDVTVSIK
jgi:hypothetical protein